MESLTLPPAHPRQEPREAGAGRPRPPTPAPPGVSVAAGGMALSRGLLLPFSSRWRPELALVLVGFLYLFGAFSLSTTWKHRESEQSYKNAGEERAGGESSAARPLPPPALTQEVPQKPASSPKIHHQWVSERGGKAGTDPGVITVFYNVFVGDSDSLPRVERLVKEQLASTRREHQVLVHSIGHRFLFQIVRFLHIMIPHPNW